MPWKPVNKIRKPYVKPVVKLNWYTIKSTNTPIASFSFTAKAMEKLRYNQEDWCNIKKDETKLLFEFTNEKVNYSRKVNKSLTPIAVRLYKVSLKPVKPYENKAFLMHIEEPKKGWIDLAQPVDPKECVG